MIKDDVEKLQNEMLAEYKKGKISFSISFVNLIPTEKSDIIDALQYLEDKGIVSTKKASGFWDFKLTAYGIDVMERMKKEMDGVSIYDFEPMMNKASVSRNGKHIGDFRVLYNSDDEKIDFPPNDFKPEIGDVVSLCGETHTITKVTEERPFNDQLFSYIASFKKHSDLKSNTVFNIHNAPNSIIGTQHQAIVYNAVNAADIRKEIENIENTEDSKALKKLVDRIEEIIEDNQPVTKGAFSRYADVLAKYTPVATGVASLILQWLSFK